MYSSLFKRDIHSSYILYVYILKTYDQYCYHFHTDLIPFFMFRDNVKFVIIASFSLFCSPRIHMKGSQRNRGGADIQGIRVSKMSLGFEIFLF